MVMVAARVWGGRPSAYLGPIAPLVALELDVALAGRALQDLQAERDAVKADPEVLKAGSSYDHPGLWDVPLEDPGHAAVAQAAFEQLRRSEAGKTH